jgi:hypothetical protein
LTKKLKRDNVQTLFLAVLYKKEGKTTNHKGGLMRQLSVFVSLAIVSIACNLAALDNHPTITVTKDDANYYVWECNQRSNSNAADIPLDVAAEAVENATAIQSDTADSKPIGFAGLSKGRMVRERNVDYDKDRAFFTAGTWKEFPTEKIANVPMLAVFIFGLIIILLMSMRSFMAIKPGPFKKMIGAVIGSFIGLILTKLTLTLISESVASSGLSPLIVFLCLLAGLVFGAMPAILFSRKAGNQTQKGIFLKSLYITTGIFYGIVGVGAFLNGVDSILGLPSIRLPGWVIISGLNIGVVFGAALGVIFMIDKRPRAVAGKKTEKMEEHRKTFLLHCLTTLPLFIIVLPAIFGAWAGVSSMVILTILLLIVPWLLRGLAQSFKKAKAAREADAKKRVPGEAVA